MPLVRAALIATAACLIGAAAYAQPATGDATSPAGDPSTQQSPQTPPTGNPPAQTGSSDMNAGGSMNGQSAAPATPDTTAGAPASPDASGSSNMNAAPTGAAANTSANVTTDANGTQVIASQPVPDTPANRKAYGSPLSMTGKRTAPVGN
jgi:hypothetical protein